MKSYRILSRHHLPKKVGGKGDSEVFKRSRLCLDSFSHRADECISLHCGRLSGNLDATLETKESGSSFELLLGRGTT